MNAVPHAPLTFEVQSSAEAAAYQWCLTLAERLRKYRETIASITISSHTSNEGKTVILWAKGQPAAVAACPKDITVEIFHLHRWLNQPIEHTSEWPLGECEWHESSDKAVELAEHWTESIRRELPLSKTRVYLHTADDGGTYAVWQSGQVRAIAIVVRDQNKSGFHYMRMRPIDQTTLDATQK